MVLSSSTLNLKFMQRAAARNAQAQTNGTTSTPSTPLPTAAPVASSSLTPTPAARVAETTPKSTSIHVSSAAEEAAGEEVWFMPNRPARPARAVEPSKKWTFEPSYVPFLAKAREGSQGGGGRMKFGFGEEEKKAEDDEAEDSKDREIESDGGENGDEPLTTTRKVPLSKSQNRQPDRQFHRPKGFDKDVSRGDARAPAKTGPSSTLDRLRGLAGSKKRKHEEVVTKEEASTSAAGSVSASKSAESVVAGSVNASTGLGREQETRTAVEGKSEDATGKAKKKKKKSGKEHNKDRD